MKLKVRCIVAALAGMLTTVMLTGCGGGGQSASSGIRGVAVERSGGSPAVQGNPPQVFTVTALPGLVITVQPAGGGAEIARATADANGGFKIDLPPGSYKLAPIAPAQPPQGTLASVASVPVDVIVSRGAYALQVAYVQYSNGVLDSR